MKKFRVKCELPWSHHRHGWPYCNNAIYRHLHSPNGVDLYTNGIIGVIKQSTIERPWIAFVHATVPEIQELVAESHWMASLHNCLGLYTFCTNTQKVLNQYVITESFKHPTHIPNITFDYVQYTNNPRVVHIGHWMRKFESFGKLKTKHSKILLNCTNLKFDYPDTEVMNYVSEETYDNILNSHAVFLDLKDATANNTIIECIVHNTPIIVNRLPATEEYLGGNYPLFFSSLEEAATMLDDKKMILEGHNYLRSLDKSKFSIETFIHCIKESKIYNKITYKFL